MAGLGVGVGEDMAGFGGCLAGFAGGLDSVEGVGAGFGLEGSIGSSSPPKEVSVVERLKDDSWTMS